MEEVQKLDRDQIVVRSYVSHMVESFERKAALQSAGVSRGAFTPVASEWATRVVGSIERDAVNLYL